MNEKKYRRIVCMGDSITYGYLLPSTRSYPAALSARLEDTFFDTAEVYNCGSVGCGILQSRFCPYEKDTAFDEALEANGDYYLIMLGTNDAEYDLENVSRYDFRQDYLYLLKRLAKVRPDAAVYLMTPPPVEPKNTFGINALQLAHICEDIRDIAVTEELPLIDIEQTFPTADMAETSAIASIKSGGSRYPGLLLSDGVHPSEAGAARIADLVYEKLRPVLLG